MSQNLGILQLNYNVPKYWDTEYPPFSIRDKWKSRGVRCPILKHFRVIKFLINFPIGTNEKLMGLGVQIRNPTALRMAKTPQSFGHSKCNRVKYIREIYIPNVNLALITILKV